MSLSTRLILSVLIFLTCTGLLGVSAISGMRGMRTHFDAAAERYEELRTLYEIGNRCAITRQLLSAESPDRELIGVQLSMALGAIDRGEDPALFGALSGRIRDAAQGLEREAGLKTVSAGTNAALDQVAKLIGAAQASIVENRRLASDRLTFTIRVIALLGIATILAGALVGVMLHRSVMRPVRALAGATDRLARAEFGDRLAPEGDREFRALIERFNRMGDELDRLHTTMREQVERKSGQLVRSERLASVGTLAAGLAHEINNPLGIIAGCAESTARKIGMNGDNEIDAALRGRIVATLGMIVEEAHRCSAITGELLTMARPSGGELRPIALAPVVERAVALAGGAPAAKGREVLFDRAGAGGSRQVVGDEPQLLQVLLNLLTNALEATAEGEGRVVVTIEEQGGIVVVTVRDNGMGMDEAALARIFEPFYTDKPSRGLRGGAGLGLSISHAIAQRHGGRLHAHSDGPGKGSALSLELPRCAEVVVRSGANGARRQEHAGI